ncbi:hypothetical protein D9Q98_001277 [Chlorella vulgaris]|uniref:Uncharacterized protein n=1 Tax=Chlorella vulgaris TaxID=3077 RepID=A0A9D4TZV0_CHLVU|nr:hypothetical protein D9Q98_001277 [Chlorella vulgaris]
MFLSRLFSTQDDRLAYSRLRDGVADQQEGHTLEVAAELQAKLAAKRAEQELAEAQKGVEEASAERARLADAVQALAAASRRAAQHSAHENAKGEGQPLSADLPATSRGRRGFDREAVKAESEACATRMRALCEVWAAFKNAENQLQAAQKRLAEAQRAKKECDAAAKQAERAAWASQPVSLDRKNQ